MEGSNSRKSTTRDNEDSISIFFDFGASNMESQASKHGGTSSSTTQSQEPGNRGGIRVSLACVPCRSRHVKCGAETPACARCQDDGKPCFYAKSRRGMRDKNTPQKRAAMRDALQRNPSSTGTLGSSYRHSSQIVGSSNDSYTGHSSEGSASPGSQSSKLSGKPASMRRLLELYYTFFHKAQPFLLPRRYFMKRLETDPDSLRNLIPAMRWIGSVYAPEIPSASFRESALQQLELPNLPPDSFTVQALLITAIALNAEDEMDRARYLLDRAIYLALEIGLHSRTYAQMETDPVLAECWRRTYWGCYVADGAFATIRRARSFILYTVQADVELPCEEYDYEGVIPHPRTLLEYDARDFEEEMPVFSSFTYLIDLTRITGAMLFLDDLRGADLELAVANADAMLLNWQLHLPLEKRGIIDKNEEVDEMIFHAHGLVQCLQVYLHRPLSRLYHSPIEKTPGCSPPPPKHEPTSHESRTYWMHTKKTLDAADAAISLYALPSPILFHSTLGLSGIALSILAQLSGCCYVVQGPEWKAARDRIRLGLGCLKAFGEVWRASRRTEKETKEIARDVFGSVGSAGSGSGSLPVEGVGSGGAFEFGAMNGVASMSETPLGFDSLDDLEYFGALNGMEQQSMNQVHI